MFFDTRPPAPLAVRWARVIVPLFLCFAYAAFRVAPAVHGMIPAAEVITMGVVFAGLMLVAFGALSELIYPRADRLADDAAERQLLGEVADWGRIEGDLLATAAGNWRGRTEAKAELIRRGYGYDPGEAATEEFELLTHEYVPQHHTPARGIPMLENVHGTVTGRIPSPAPRATGRHRLVKD